MRGRLAIAIGVVVAVISLGLALGFGVATVWVAFIAIGVAKSVWRNAGEEKQQYETELQNAEARLTGIQDRWIREASDARFKQKLADLIHLKIQYGELDKLRQSRLQELQRNLYQSQLRRYLDQFPISSANIPNIGDTRKAMLASFNIDTAADVTAAAVDSVPGFGRFLTGKLLEWRRGLEAKFVFHPNRAIDPEDLRSLEPEISDRRSRLEASLLGGPAELARVSAQILSARHVLWKELESANRDAFQARANARAA